MHDPYNDVDPPEPYPDDWYDEAEVDAQRAQQKEEQQAELAADQAPMISRWLVFSVVAAGWCVFAAFTFWACINVMAFILEATDSHHIHP
jgi:hypothetical protein